MTPNTKQQVLYKPATCYCTCHKEVYAVATQNICEHCYNQQGWEKRMHFVYDDSGDGRDT